MIYLLIYGRPSFQEGRVKNKMWQDRAVSFFLGILASMIASLVFTLIRTTMLKKRNDED